MFTEKQLKVPSRKNKKLKLVEYVYWENQLEFPTFYCYYSFQDSKNRMSHIIGIACFSGEEIELGVICANSSEEVDYQVNLVRSNLEKLIKNHPEITVTSFIELDRERIASYIEMNKRYERYRQKKKKDDEQI